MGFLSVHDCTFGSPEVIVNKDGLSSFLQSNQHITCLSFHRGGFARAKENLADSRNSTSFYLSQSNTESEVIGGLAKLKNLTSLRFISCDIDSKIVRELAKLKNFISLRFISCDIDSGVAEELVKLKNLASLRLRQCNIDSKVPGELSAKLKELSKLNLSPSGYAGQKVSNLENQIVNGCKKEIELKSTSSKKAEGSVLAKREKSEGISTTKNSQEISAGPENLAPVLNNGQEANPVVGTTVHDNKSNVKEVQAANPWHQSISWYGNKDSGYDDKNKSLNHINNHVENVSTAISNQPTSVSSGDETERDPVQPAEHISQLKQEIPSRQSTRKL